MQIWEDRLAVASRGLTSGRR